MGDSDTEDDLLSNNILTFQNQEHTISAKGPNINSTNISGLSFRNNVMTSTMSMAWNMDRPRYAESVSDQRSMNYNRERERSPMSLHSASGMHPRNIHHPYYPGAMGSHRSMYNGRSRSPTMSVRSFDSNRSMSAKDIAFAFQNGNFNKLDFQMIKEAYNRFIKHRTRKRIEKRRNVRMFLKGLHRTSGGDSGDQASNSSISSDDCRSTRTSRSTIYKDNMSSCRSTKTDISDLRKTMRESNMYKDCSDNFRQNSFKSMFSGGQTRQKENMQSKWPNNSMVNSVTQPQKERFRSGFQIPSRFNQPITSLPIPEKSYGLKRINEGNMLDIRHNVPDPSVHRKNLLEMDSEQEEIFADVTVLEKRSVDNSGKRVLEGADIPVPEKKRPRFSPPKNYAIPKTPKQNRSTALSTQKSNDFVFAKPQLPPKKTTITKQQKPVKSMQLKVSSLPKEKPVKPTEEKNTSKVVDLPVEKVISSSQKAVKKPISMSSEPSEPVTAIRENNVQKTSEYISPEKESLPTDTTLQSTTDISMRPSFIKRKLFTQKVDVAEKNSSSDSLQADSPQTNVYSKIQKEKNRARKLVTSQSCLNRDVGDDSNLLDLIHKIVPADRMNVTTAANKSETQNNKSKPANADKFDVTSLITTCNNTDDVSDTFTDEEIFDQDDGQKQQTENINKSKTVQKQLQSNKQTIQNPIETKKKTANGVKNITAGKEQNNNKTNKISNQKNAENHKNTKSLDTKKNAVTAKVDVKNGVPVTTQCNNNPLTQVQKAVMSPQCKVVNENASYIHKEAANTVMGPVSPTERLGFIKASQALKGVKSFWDSDTESELETTLLKRIHTKNTALPTENLAEAPVKKVTAPLIQANVTSTNKQSQNKTKCTVQVKTVVNQNINSTILNKNNNNLAKKPKNINKSPENNNVDSISVQNELAKTKSKPAEKIAISKKISVSKKEIYPPADVSKNINKSPENNNVESITVQSELAKTKGKPAEKIANSKKISLSKKENYPPADVSKTAKNKFNASLKLQNDGVSQKLMKKTASKAKITLTNNNSTLSNDESQHNKIHNSTKKIRAQRKPKAVGCCGEQNKLHESVNKNNTSGLCRSLRSREVDLSTSLKSDDGNVTVAKKTAAKNKRPAKPNKIAKIIKEKTLPSDVSFTLATDVSLSDRTLRNKKASAHYKQHKLRQSDVSFTLAPENTSLNDTVSTRSSRKNREVASLLDNSASFFKSGKPSQPRKNLAAESRAMNKSRNLRLNRSRRLL